MSGRILEGRAQKIILEMREEGKVKSFSLENKNYWDSARKIKDNFKSDLKEGGVIFGVPIEEYKFKISYD